MKVIGSLLYYNGRLVNKYGFATHRPVGNLSFTIQRLEELQVDEIAVFNRSHSKNPYQDFLRLQEEETGLKRISTPLCYAGGINEIYHAEKLIHLGVERVILSVDHLFSGLGKGIAEILGEQAIVYHLPYQFERNRIIFRSSRGGIDADTVLSEIPKKFSGELIITSIDSEGTAYVNTGHLRQIIAKIPNDLSVVYSGGVRDQKQLEYLHELKLNGVCLGNVLNTKEIFVLSAKYYSGVISRPIQE